MRIERISVSYSETVSLPEYCNVRPGLTLEARLDEDEDAGVLREQLTKEVQGIVREEVNRALEVNGKRAKYHDGPWFQVMYSRPRKVVAILPNDAEPHGADGLDDFSHRYMGDSRKIRLGHAQTKAAQLGEDLGFPVVDCSDGDLSRLPAPALVEDDEEDLDMPF